jgi:preprotein translocase subunit SecF
MRTIAPLLLFFFSVISMTAQQNADTLSISEKFNLIYKTSSSYQEYKVIGKTRFQQLKKEVSDSIQLLKSEIESKNQQIDIQKDSIKEARQVADIVGKDYQQMVAQKNSMQFLGIEFTKSTYNLVVWSFIGILLILLLYFIYRFKNNNTIAINSKRELSELEEEFAIHKKKSLEREQKIRRQLQDEINKQRGV